MKEKENQAFRQFHVIINVPLTRQEVDNGIDVQKVFDTSTTNSPPTKVTLLEDTSQEVKQIATTTTNQTSNTFTKKLKECVIKHDFNWDEVANEMKLTPAESRQQYYQRCSNNTHTFNF